MRTAVDPWAQLTDLDGREKYRILQVSYSANQDEIKKAYRELAKKHHPDKGGSAAQFAAVQGAFETLSNRTTRAVYDEWAKEVRFRNVSTRGYKAQGGEDIMLDELEKAGVTCDPLTQLVLLCQVCGRPSTKECWTCRMPICSFCTLKRHWKEGFPLHWPLINSDHMQTQLAKRELEKKRVEDARLTVEVKMTNDRLDMEDPNWRSESQLKDIRSFKVAACRMLEREDRLVHYDYSLARFYMWAQTDVSVHIAVQVATGYEDREVKVECNSQLLRIQPQDSPPVVERAFDGQIDLSEPITSFSTKDNRLVVVSLKKLGAVSWCRLFKGDSDGARCMQPLYRISESEKDVSIEADVPHWVEADDVAVELRREGISMEVCGVVSCRRTFWTPSQAREDRARAQFEAIDIPECLWSLEQGSGAAGEPAKMLLINLAKPEPNEEEVTWKRGKRQDNLTAERPGHVSQRGFRFFQDDEDEFGLEDILQAVCFLEVGRAFVPSKPWEQGSHSRTVADSKLLSAAAQQHLEALTQK